ncbi:hypothetical protein Dda_9152 [Drechslerella dactyloides]|uniref:Uncharacterized protein n=1 Tax=Drechslerella dactyloides TaxID=74499 RepID=A0AAD6NF99_DREDA|nr:hypothetical protein Dda_9152 [Drechslerella dactyloides]
MSSMHHERETPKLDTRAEHNHPIDSTHNPTQGRSQSEENRRASAGEILLAETDVAWLSPIQEANSRDGPNPPSSPSSSRAECIKRKRRNSSYGSVGAHNESPAGSTGPSYATSKPQPPILSELGGRRDEREWKEEGEEKEV